MSIATTAKKIAAHTPLSKPLFEEIRVFRHSGPEILGSAREGKPRSFFLCFVKIFKKVVAFGVTRAADPRAWTGWVRRRVDRLSENDASSSATRKWLLLTSKSEMLASKSLFLIADVEPRNCR